MTFNTEAFGWIGTALGIFWGIISQFRAQRATDRAQAADKVAGEVKAQEAANAALIATKEQLIATVNQDRDSWKGMFSAKDAELAAYRAEVHERNKSTQAQLFRLQEENTELRVKTDLTPVVLWAKTQAAGSEKMFRALTMLVKGQRHILEVLGIQNLPPEDYVESSPAEPHDAQKQALDNLESALTKPKVTGSVLPLLLCFVLNACASSPRTHHTPATRAPSLAPITRDIRDAKESVGRAFKSSIRVEDYRSRIEFKAARILERWERKPRK